MRFDDLKESGMYSNTRPKLSLAHSNSSGSNPNTPDDVFITASDDRPGLVAVSLKGRTAFVRPETAKELAETLLYCAEKVSLKQETWHIDQIRNQVKKDWLIGTYNNIFPEHTPDAMLYDQEWNLLVNKQT
jgi:hypothetical protein